MFIHGKPPGNTGATSYSMRGGPANQDADA